MKIKNLSLDDRFVYLPDPTPPRGLSPQEVLSSSTLLQESLATLIQSHRSGKLGFMDLPFDEALCGEVEEYALHRAPPYDTLLVLGIGGSTLGIQALHQALKPW
ncbi:MAG TPA: hypothetical protein PLB68_05940, partial [Candidatus Aminicenantes bacterium]|nr:hypothetical protein [Candidatus Aminicenantes bacterium]